MSITRIYSVFCDDGSSPHCHGWIAESTAGAKEARSEALAAGWRVRGGDICPACQKKQQGDNACARHLAPSF